ncbi:MAG TPA: thrombospondin type 3 repeat-containing protein [Phycisphaerae bacterium]|nr:thrombospondin type 3 repeat-containing protein [Phycisphaerae bacterium]
MSHLVRRGAFILPLCIVAVVGRARAVGPDIIVGELDGITRWGREGDITAYSVGTHSCNIGDADMAWEEDTNAHPVIAQNMYRLKAGRFEQIGQSWIKHGLIALNTNLCSTCPDPQIAPQLHPGCSDPYSSGLNGRQDKLGPRAEVNASTGAFPGPPPPPPGALTLIDRRLQVQDADLEPDLNAGASYFVESLYIAADDAAAGNDDNNASYRRVTVSEPNESMYMVALAGTTQRQKAAIQAWAEMDATVAIAFVDVAGDGRLIVAGKVTELPDGFWEYEYAVENLNSDRSMGTFGVALHDATSVEAVGFHDVDYHSGEPFDGTDWEPSRPTGMLLWTTTGHDVNPNANALRWGTLYNFRFRTNSPPTSNAEVALGLFKPGTPTSVTATIVGPAAWPVDCNTNTIPDYLEIQENPLLDCDTNGYLDECDAATGLPDCNGNGSWDACDIAGGSSDDCDSDRIPDECEIPVGSPAAGGPFFCTTACDPDCNSNGVPDSCDIASLADADCNSNGIPDSCDIAGMLEDDCNTNGVPDSCEIAAGTSNDCNTNQIPDGCEIAAHPEFDCNGNSFLDECDVDRDGDSYPDDCDNCPEAANAGQEDGDGDGLGDVCDSEPPPPPGGLPSGACCGTGSEAALGFLAGLGVCGFRWRRRPGRPAPS